MKVQPNEAALKGDNQARRMRWRKEDEKTNYFCIGAIRSPFAVHGDERVSSVCCDDDLSIDHERSVHELHHLIVLLLSVPRYVSDRMPHNSLLCSGVQCCDLVRPLRLGSL